MTTLNNRASTQLDAVIRKKRTRPSSQSIIRLKRSSPFKITLTQSEEKQKQTHAPSLSVDFMEVFREVAHLQLKINTEQEQLRKLVKQTSNTLRLTSKLQSYYKVVNNWRPKREDSTLDSFRFLERAQENAFAGTNVSNYVINAARSDLQDSQPNNLDDHREKYLKHQNSALKSSVFRNLKDLAHTNFKDSLLQLESERLHSTKVLLKPAKFAHRKELINIVSREYGRSNSKELINIKVKQEEDYELLKPSVTKLLPLEDSSRKKTLRRTLSAPKVDSLSNSYLRILSQRGQSNNIVLQTESNNMNITRIVTEPAKQEPLFKNFALQQINQTQTQVDNQNQESKKNSKQLCSWSQIKGRKAALKKFSIIVKDEKDESNNMSSKLEKVIPSFQQTSTIADNDISKSYN